MFIALTKPLFGDEKLVPSLLLLCLSYIMCSSLLFCFMLCVFFSGYVRACIRFRALIQDFSQPSAIVFGLEDEHSIKNERDVWIV